MFSEITAKRFLSLYGGIKSFKTNEARILVSVWKNKNI
jgi:hypothetical protein